VNRQRGAPNFLTPSIPVAEKRDPATSNDLRKSMKKVKEGKGDPLPVILK